MESDNALKIIMQSIHSMAYSPLPKYFITINIYLLYYHSWTWLSFLLLWALEWYFEQQISCLPLFQNFTKTQKTKTKLMKDTINRTLPKTQG